MYWVFMVLLLFVLFGGFGLYFVRMLIGKMRGEYFRVD